jgi:transposase
MRERGLSGQQAAETLCLPRSTLYRWERQLKREGPKGLEERSRRPKRVRRPEWSPELVQAVLRLREQYPAWGKETLQVLLVREGWQTSVSTVGRILAQLKARRVLVEAPRRAVSVRRRPSPEARCGAMGLCRPSRTTMEYAARSGDVEQSPERVGFAGRGRYL